MWEIVEDSTIGANFAVLIIVKLDKKQQLEGSVTVFIPNYRSFRGELIQ